MDFFETASDNWDLGSVIRSCSCSAVQSSSLNTNPLKTIAANSHNTVFSMTNDTYVVPNEKNGPSSLNSSGNQVFGNDKSFYLSTLIESHNSTSNDNSILLSKNTTIENYTTDIPHMTRVSQNQQAVYPHFTKPFNSPLVPQNHSMHEHAEIPSSLSMMRPFSEPTYGQPLYPSMPVLGRSSSHYFQKFQMPQVNPHGSYRIPPLSPLTRPKSFGRRNMLKKITRQVTREDLGDDEWAWRKYGQKPIKGSIYPRNYYRCSSSKGCAARKQVERSATEPNMFIITYTGEHTHTHVLLPKSNARNSRTRYPKDNHIGPSKSLPDSTAQEKSYLNHTQQDQVVDVDSMSTNSLKEMIMHDQEGDDMHLEDLKCDDFFAELEELNVNDHGISGGCNNIAFDEVDLATPTNSFGDLTLDSHDQYPPGIDNFYNGFTNMDFGLVTENLFSSPSWALGNSSTCGGSNGGE